MTICTNVVAAEQVVVLYRGVSAQIKMIDARAFLAGLTDESVDLIVTSPPYCMGKEYEASVSVDDFVAEMRSVFPDMVRVLKAGGNLCWQVGYHVQKNVVTPLDALIYVESFSQKELYFRNRIIWTFGHGSHLKRRFSGRHETIMWFSKGDEYHFDLDAIRIAQKYPGKRHYKGAKKGAWSGHPLGKNPEDVWDIPNVKASHPEKTIMPCQFPIELVERCVLALTDENDWVLDPYAGVGSTLVASVMHNRRAMGSEKIQEYVKISRDRIRRLFAGTLKTRPLERPIYVPSKSEKVAQPPEEWNNTKKSS